MNVEVTTGQEISNHEGDPIDVMPGVLSKIVDAVYHGDAVKVLVTDGEFDWCDKCATWTANHEPRRFQKTRYTRGYYVCPVCGYTKEGVVP